MKRILKELESRDGYDRIAAALLYREIEDANDSLYFERIHDDYENEQKNILFKGSKEILDILADEYKITLPESSSLEDFDKDFNNEHTLYLAQYASLYHNETIEEEKCVQDNEKGKVLVKQLYHSVYKGSTN